mgnify:FL=1
MKKIFALALAAVMTAGMATTSFATSLEARNDAEVVLLGGFKMVDVYVDSNDNNRFNESDDTFTPDKGSEKTNGKFTSSVVVNEGDIANVDLSVVKGGKKVAIPLLDKDGNMIDDKDAVRRIKVKAEWKVGELSEKPEIEFVKIGAEYAYAVTFTLPESAEIKTTDLAGKIAVYESSSQLKDNYSDKEYITLSFGSEYGFNTEDYDGSDLAKAEVVDFDDYSDDVETLTFGDDFEFEVDLSGQGKLNLKNNRDFNKEFAAMYDYANIDFINFVKTPSFNKNGTVYIYADEDAYIYEVTADGAKEIKGLKWDEDYEAWTFKTRTLKSYAISDVELTEKTVTEDKDDTTTDGGKENPDTGR